MMPLGLQDGLELLLPLARGCVADLLPKLVHPHHCKACWRGMRHQFPELPHLLLGLIEDRDRECRHHISGVPALEILPVVKVKGLRFVPTGSGVLSALAKLTKECLELGIKVLRTYLVASRLVVGGDAWVSILLGLSWHCQPYPVYHLVNYQDESEGRQGLQGSHGSPDYVSHLGVTHSQVERHLLDPLEVVVELIQECLGDQLSLSHRPSILEAFVQEVLHVHQGQVYSG